jgi:hypothetical protein
MSNSSRFPTDIVFMHTGDISMDYLKQQAENALNKNVDPFTPSGEQIGETGKDTLRAIIGGPSPAEQEWQEEEMLNTTASAPVTGSTD